MMEKLRALDLHYADVEARHVPSRLKMYIREPFALVKSFLFDR